MHSASRVCPWHKRDWAVSAGEDFAGGTHGRARGEADESGASVKRALEKSPFPVSSVDTEGEIRRAAAGGSTDLVQPTRRR